MITRLPYLLTAWGAMLCCTAALYARTWTDQSGRFQVEADFLKLEAGKVYLDCDDGRSIAVPLSKLSEDDRQFVRRKVLDRKDSAAEEAEEKIAKAAAAWKVENLTATLKQEYTCRIGFQSIKVMTTGLTSFAVVKFNLTASNADPKAFDKLSKQRALLARVSPLGGLLLLNRNHQQQLAGKYRYFSGAMALLVDSNKRVYTPNCYFNDGGPSHGGPYFSTQVNDANNKGTNPPTAPWALAFTTDNSFDGLLEVSKPASVYLVYVIPANLKLSDLRLRLDNAVESPLEP